MQQFSDLIISWYHENKRDLPWRQTINPYYIWLSEIILQQTQIKQGLPYYEKFIAKFPTVVVLAKAQESEVLKLWQGLGYYSRARNLHHTAKEIAAKHKGLFPDSFEDLLKLKGIGRYTAAAISSIAFGNPHAVVDGNVYRLLSRYHGIKTPIDSTIGKKKFESLANKLLDKKHPANFNQAMMEIGATVCKPQNPDCVICPLNQTCFAYGRKTMHKFPVKEKKTKITDRWLFYVVMRTNNEVVLRKRTGNDIWKNMYDFPLVELEEKQSVEKVIESAAFKKLVDSKKRVIEKVTELKVHKLSHQNIHAVFIKVFFKKLSKLQGDNLIVSLNDWQQYPFPKIIADYFSKEF